MSWHDLHGRAAFITAAGAGIGRAIALEWTRLGGAAFLSDRDGEAAAAVAAEIGKAGGEAQAAALDVADRNATAAAFGSAVQALGGLDAIFNVAGVNDAKTVEEMDDEVWDRTIDTNLGSVFRVSRLAVPMLRKRGGGAIVNIASTGGVMGANRSGAYSASKGAIVLLTRSMAMDFAADKIRVNAVCPGSTRTPRLEAYWQATGTGKSVLAEQTPMKRSAEPEEVAIPAVFLATEGASYITGAVLVVDGGLTAGIRNPTFDQL